MQAFARDFFAFHGAAVTEAAGRLQVALTEPLAAHFGEPALTLCFSPHDPAGALVAPGSRVFDLMASYVAGRGRMAAFVVPAGDWPVPTPNAVAGALSEPVIADAPRRYAVYDFLLAFLTDERAEHGLAIALDDAGVEAPEALGWLAEAGRAGVVDAAVPALEPQARRHQAESLARAEAERRAAAVEAEAAARLARMAARLTDYYEAMVLEVPLRRRKGRSVEDELAEADAERAMLRADLARRLAEEARRHQLRVQVRLLGMATLAVPGRRLGWRLATADGGVARQVEAWQDLATGATAWPACARCGERHDRFGLCREGHLACAACLGRCAACGADHCTAELTGCEACGAARCAACLGRCAGGHRVCRTHLAGCPCCGLAYCPACPPHAPLVPAGGLQ